MGQQPGGGGQKGGAGYAYAQAPSNLPPGAAPPYGGYEYEPPPRS